MDPIWLMNTTIKYYNEPQLEALPFYPWQIVLIMVYSTTAFISLGSNALTILILLRSEQVSSELWKFLLNLSISDILMSSICIPFTYTNYMLGRWIFPRFLCPIIPFIQITSVSVSIWTLTFIGIDRYFAIVYPFRQIAWLKRHKVTTIMFIWFLGALIASPQLYYSRIESFKYRGQHFDDCREQFTLQGGKIYTIFIFLFTFFIPIMALIFVYARIGFHLIRNSSTPGNPDQIRDKVCINKKIKVIKMLVTIVLLFAMCWFPIHLLQLLVWFYPSIQNQKTKFSYYVYVGSYFLCHWLAMAHSLVNPFVYCFMSDNFRQSLRQTFKNFISVDGSRNSFGKQRNQMMDKFEKSSKLDDNQLYQADKHDQHGQHNDHNNDVRINIDDNNNNNDDGDDADDNLKRINFRDLTLKQIKQTKTITVVIPNLVKKEQKNDNNNNNSNYNNYNQHHNSCFGAQDPPPNNIINAQFYGTDGRSGDDEFV